MRKLLLIILGMFIGFIPFYLAGAFAQANFNIVKWSEGARTIIAFAGLVGGFLGGALVSFNLEEFNKR